MYIDNSGEIPKLKELECRNDVDSLVDSRCVSFHRLPNSFSYNDSRDEGMMGDLWALQYVDMASSAMPDAVCVP